MSRGSAAVFERPRQPHWRVHSLYRQGTENLAERSSPEARWQEPESCRANDVDVYVERVCSKYLDISVPSIVGIVVHLFKNNRMKYCHYANGLALFPRHPDTTNFVNAVG